MQRSPFGRMAIAGATVGPWFYLAVAMAMGAIGPADAQQGDPVIPPGMAERFAFDAADTDAAQDAAMQRRLDFERQRPLQAAEVEREIEERRLFEQWQRERAAQQGHG